MSTATKKTKGKNFCSGEMQRMLDIVEECLPFGAEQWSNVAAQYNTHLPNGWPERDGESLKRKFLGLMNKQKPTGDPDCPPEVKRAKRAFYRIQSRCAVTTLHDDDAEDVQPDVDSTAEQERARQNGAAVNPVGSNGVSTSTFETTDPASPSLDQVAAFINGTVDDLKEASPPTTAPSSSYATPPQLTATPRSGLTPTELAQLSRKLDMTRPGTSPLSTMPVQLSQTAQRRIRLDSMLERLTAETQAGPASPDPGFLSMLMVMEERQAARDSELHREREDREAAREERERQFRMEMA